MARLSHLALLGIIAAAVGLVLLPAFATTPSEQMYYAYGVATANKQPVDIKVNPIDITAAKGDQGYAEKTSFLQITKDGNISVVRMTVTLTNAEELKQYFRYMTIYLVNNKTGEIKGVITLDNPSTTIVIDNNDWNGDFAYINAVIYYELVGNVLFEKLPLTFSIQVTSET